MILKLLGWAAIGYVAYTCYKDGGIAAGITDIETQLKSLFGQTTPTATAPTVTATVATPKVAVSASVTPPTVSSALTWANGGVSPVPIGTTGTGWNITMPSTW